MRSEQVTVCVERDADRDAAVSASKVKICGIVLSVNSKYYECLDPKLQAQGEPYRKPVERPYFGRVLT